MKTFRLLVICGLYSTLTSSVYAFQNSAGSWKVTEASGNKAAKEAHFAEAEKLLTANLAVAENISQTVSSKDDRLPATLFDLAQVYRAEGKYTQAFPLYERALKIYQEHYGAEAAPVAEVMEGEAELYKNLNDYAHAEPLLLKTLAIRQNASPPLNADLAQTQNDLGELYTAIGAYDKAEPLLAQALVLRPS